jgi:hypothetical protein
MPPAADSPARAFPPTEDGERDYIEQNHERLAGIARAGFERFGRGVILITVRPPHAPDKAGTIEYVNDDEADRIWPATGWPEAATRRAVAEYDPARAFLVLVLDYQFQTCRLHRFEEVAPADR